ncbi:serine/threonine-protein kinase [Lusitaniella coriacea]|uniref:serine/threonine-protein kinase n=1 Tax=Lusitaniella coriacea TaxID=1983105 RepID=UPI003CEE4F8D
MVESPDSGLFKVEQLKNSSSFRATHLPKIGDILANQYQIVESIGEGTQGCVFKAVDFTTDQYVAIKISRKNQLDFERLRQKYDAITQLKHTGIVSIHKFIQESSDCSFLVMDYVEGQSIRQLIENEVKIEHSRAVSIVVQLAEALDYLHNHRFYHLDLKPENILVNEQERVFLLDFGTTLADQELWDKEGKVYTTYSYADSKSLVGLTRNISRTTEVYSLGVILYEMLTGSYLNSDDSKESSFVNSVLISNLSLDLEFPDGVPKEICNACLKCIQQDTADSFLSAGKLAKYLKKLIENSKLHADTKSIEENDKSDKEKALFAWRLGNKLSESFYYHSTYRLLISELVKNITENISIDQNQLGLTIIQEIGALENLKECQGLAKNLKLHLTGSNDAIYHQIVRSPRSVSIDQIKELPVLAEEMSRVLDKAEKDISRHLKTMREQFHTIFEMRFLLRAGNRIKELSNEFLRNVAELGLPKEYLDELGNLVEKAFLETFSEETLKRNLNNLDRFFEQYLIGTDS